MSANSTNRRKDGIILLIVLSMLTFFSLLMAAYLVFSNQSRQASFLIAGRLTHEPDVNGLLNESLMKLIRGTANTKDPFFGEDLLSDFYGRTDALNLRVRGNLTPIPTYNVGGGFIRVPMEQAVAPFGRPIPFGATTSSEYPVDDLYAGRVITFIDGPLINQSFRVIRSQYDVSTNRDDLIIELGPQQIVSPITESLVMGRLYPGGAATAAGHRFHMNGVPRNSPGIGFDGTNVNRNSSPHAAPASGGGFTNLPLAFQPNHVGDLTDKLQSGVSVGDFDESYDAADFNNWFLSHRHAVIGGSTVNQVIPSFHRPAVINYLLNQMDWASATPANYQQLSLSLARATFRPLPFEANQLAASSTAVNPKFTGGSSSFALRAPLNLATTSNPRPRLDQLARTLISSPGDLNPWDVDNDADGIPDSIWIDLGLPVITSREGKLLRPLIAPMIEDLSGRLNVNAHGNSELANNAAGVSASALWSSSRQPFAATSAPTVPNALHTASRFRGLGYGPAEIVVPMVNNTTLITDTQIQAGLATAASDRWQYGERTDVTNPPPGQLGADDLDILRTGFRPRFHTSTGGYGYSIDPFGRSGAGVGRDGQLVLANAGTATTAATANEAIDDPYESDPTGRLSGDRHFTVEDLEAVLRSNYFDLEMMPPRLRNRVGRLIDQNPEFASLLTTISSSHDNPVVAANETSILPALIDSLGLAKTTANATIVELIAPDLRLGRKLDVNRPFGNGVDDNITGTSGFGTIDEPNEVETVAFAVEPGSGMVVPTEFQTATPDYNLDTTTGVSGRELLARHLYVLMMALTADQTTFTDSMGNPISADYKARRLAQWAVNVVDYRDPDSIMTRFRYDVTPLDGWTPSGTDIVWGVEAPELTFSEAFAFHDVRVRDTNFDPGTATKTSGTPDNDTDQVRIPQGSLFMELYVPKSPIDSAATISDQTTKPGIPSELYNTVPSTALDLARLAPAPTSGGPGAPVWRIALSTPHYAASGNYPASGNETLDPATLRTTKPDTAGFEPTQLDEITPSPSLLIDRFVWFTDFADLAAINTVITSNAITDMSSDKVFFAPGTLNTTGVTVEPGQYLSIAPRIDTRLGSHAAAGTTPDRPTDQRFVVVNGEGVVHSGTDNVRITPGLTATTDAYTNAQPIIIGTFRPSGWAPNTFANGFVGLNVSEPLPQSASYYPMPTLRYMGTAGPGVNFPLNDAYIDIVASGTTALDAPLDVLNPRIPDSFVPAVPAAAGEEPAIGTIPQYCSAFLQRLADPLSAYNAVTNPYRTVDWMSIDLTVFSGEERQDKVVSSASFTRRTRQRNGFIGTAQRDALFSYATDFVAPAISIDQLATDFFSFSSTSSVNASIQSSFNFLNTADATSNTGFMGFTASLGSVGGSTGVIGNDRNLPQIPFARHPWLNRPFASHMELMMVPACSQARLFEEFSINDPAADVLVYPDDPLGTPGYAARYRGPFRHLLNFFHGKAATTEATQSGRLFDFVTTLPRFNGEVEMIRPSRVTTAPFNSVLKPPFDFQWDNQRQGRINLNTLTSLPVWAGLMAGHLNTTEFNSPTGGGQLAFDQFLTSRRGYAPGGGGPVTGTPPYNYNTAQLHPNFPTEFAGVFRNGLDARFAPAVRDSATTSLLQQKRDVNGGLLRAAGDLAVAAPESGPSNTTPFFVRDRLQAPLPATGAFVAGTPEPAYDRDRNRNPFLRYQTLMRMPNLVSDNSQTFVIRLTLGFFEVDASDTNSLGREYKEDIGQNRRFHAMFIVDRSKPVGFVPGQDLNARDVVVFERFYQ